MTEENNMSKDELKVLLLTLLKVVEKADDLAEVKAHLEKLLEALK